MKFYQHRVDSQRSWTYTINRTTLYQWCALLFALTYASFLATLPADIFYDRENYLVYASSSWAILERYIDQGWLAVFSNEPVWLLINGYLGDIWLPETTVRILIFFPAFTVAWTVLRQDANQFIWLIMILFLPMVIKNHIIHLRQGVAIAIFIAGWSITKPTLRWPLWILTPFIHASFLFILPMWVLAQALIRLRIAMNVQTLAFCALGLGIGFGLGWLATVFEARQATTYDFTAAKVSGLGFLFWAFILILNFTQGRLHLRHHAFSLSILILYLATYFLVEVTARIFESGALIVLLTCLQLTGHRRQLFLVSISLFFLLTYWHRLGPAWLG